MNDSLTWGLLLYAAKRDLKVLEPDRVQLVADVDPDSLVYREGTAWIACYPVPATNEGFHVYVDWVPARPDGAKHLHMAATGKSWTAEQAIQAAAAISRLALPRR